MFLKPQTLRASKGNSAWCCDIQWVDGVYYAFMGTGTRKPGEPIPYPTSLDIATSADGVHWQDFGSDVLNVPGAHAGFCVRKIGDRFIYYVTKSDHSPEEDTKGCQTKESGAQRSTGLGSNTRFVLYESHDLKNWRYMGKQFDVGFDTRWYAARWDELCFNGKREPGSSVMYGYITSETCREIEYSSVGLLESADGVHWTVLPPPRIEWGSLPYQHMEVGFCERIGERYYLAMSGRGYMGNYGYSMFTLVGDHPTGPFYPDLEAFRLSGTKTRDCTFLAHIFSNESDQLVSFWLAPEFPTNNMWVPPLKKAIVDGKGHLRLAYWKGNDAAKTKYFSVSVKDLSIVHPARRFYGTRYSAVQHQDALVIRAGREGLIAMINRDIDISRGAFLEGTVVLEEPDAQTRTHQPPSSVGLFFEKRPGQGTAILAETLGVTRIGQIRFAEFPVIDNPEGYTAMRDVMMLRYGPFEGTMHFETEDWIETIGYASQAGVRAGAEHSFMLLIREPFFEFYLDGYHVQTYWLPENGSGKVGLLVRDGIASFRHLRYSPMSF